MIHPPTNHRRTSPSTHEFLGAKPGLPMEDVVAQAIQEKRVIMFVYEDHMRIAEPHVLGIHDNQYGMLVYQIDGSSASGRLPDWRRIILNAISGLIVITDTHFEGKRPCPTGQHSRWDQRIAVVED